MPTAFLDELFAKRGGAMRLGLERMEELLERLGHPERKFPAVHIAGTNGKGSVAHKVARVLQENGYRVGLYTSPHLFSFCERIQVNGEPIEEEEAKRILSDLPEDATFFELTTALAFHHFAARKVDIAVVEVGLGGRLDATNVLSPLVTAITSIGLDHTEWLGDTLEKIALEKAGICKPSVPCILGPTVPREIEGIAVCGPFADFIEENCAIAEAILGQLTDFPTPKREGLSSQPPARFEEIAPRVILDVAHNPPGVRALLKATKRRFPGHKIRVVIALSKGKDIEGVLEELKGTSTYALKTDHPELIAPAGLQSVRPGEMPLKPNEVVLYCGSFFTIGEVAAALRSSSPCAAPSLLGEY